MQNLGDYELEETIDFHFTTTAPDTGAPVTLSGVPVISAYVGNSATQITAGITLTADFDTVTGLNHVRAVLTSANGYADDTDISFVITTGTVDGNSAVGYVVARCSIGRGSAYLRLGAPAGASVSADIATVDGNVDSILVDTAEIGAAGAGLTEAGGTGDHLTALATAAALATVDTEVGVIDGIVDAIVADTNELQADWVNGGRLDLLVDAVKAKTDSLTFTVANVLNANTLRINGVAITGDGSATPFGV